MISAMSRRRVKRSARLLEALEPFAPIVVLTHDNPDPDAIAAGWAVKYLLEEKTDKPVRLVGGGDIVRAENRHMVKLLRPPLELVDDLFVDRETGVVLVDCGPDATNHLIYREAVLPVAAVDHHIEQFPTKLAFADIRPQLAASATIASTYLLEQDLEPSMELATALLYAMRTETRGSGACYNRVDRAVLPWLTRRADPTLLAEIENAPLPREYFGDLLLALQGTFLYEDAGLCLLPRAQGPEIIGEVADLLVRCECVTRVLCGAVHKGHVLLSVRTTREGGDATHLLRATISGIGRGGGHPRRAGGKLSTAIAGTKMPDELQDDLRSRWLAACNVQRRRGTRLLARHEIVGNL